MTGRIYLDHAATSPLRPEARTGVSDGFSIWANPSSPHAEGRAARRALEDARERCKVALGWKGELIFTSGASEAIDLALTRANAGARLVSAVEHDAVLKAVPDAERLRVLANGALDLENLREAIDRERPLVAVQQVNSETGNRQDFAAIAAIVRDAGGMLLADCAQGAGKIALPECDMAAAPSASARCCCATSPCSNRLAATNAAIDAGPRTCPERWAWRRLWKRAGAIIWNRGW